jgi:ArsR family transcriptional regulator
VVEGAALGALEDDELERRVSNLPVGVPVLDLGWQGREELGEVDGLVEVGDVEGELQSTPGLTPRQIDVCRCEAWMIDRRSSMSPRGTVTEATTAGCCGTTIDAGLDEARSIELATGFAALADPVRLRMFSLVAAAGEVCSCDLQEPLDRSQPTISHHTKILADAGLITGEKRGRWMWRSIAPDRIAELRTSMEPGR